MSATFVSPSEDRTSALVCLVCGRIAGFARAVLEAHDLGTDEGHHERPWTEEYHLDSVGIFAASLPASYQRYVAELFGHSSEIMVNETVPGHLVEDWMIVMSYLDSASSAVSAYYSDASTRSSEPDGPPSEAIAVSESLPLVIRFDLLAQLTTSEGARRLERAAVAVRDHMETPMPTLEDGEQQMLIRLKAGMPIVDIAAELGFSERSMYRSLARLWDKLGVPDRRGGIRRATEVGLLD